MRMKRCALLDTDFISKLYITRKDDDNRLIDRILELPDYNFVCHSQIQTELKRHDAMLIDWFLNQIAQNVIKCFSNFDLLQCLRSFYGKNATLIFLFYLSIACALFDRTFYEQYYGILEQKMQLTDEDFAKEIAICDDIIGYDHNLGEIKTYVLQQVLQNEEDLLVYIFCSDDQKARTGIFNAGGLPCISALSSFYLLKEVLGMEKCEARLYFDSWMQFHQSKNQTRFKVHRNTKEMQLMKMDGYEIFEHIYNGNMMILKNGNLKLQ